MQLDFYQIGQAGLEQVMLMLLKKTLAANQKALVLCPMPAASAIDTALWTHDPESWIPHGLDDANGADFCHVWVSSDMAANPITLIFVSLHGSAPAHGLGLQGVSVCLMGSRMHNCNKHVITGKCGKSLMIPPLAITLKMRKGDGMKKASLLRRCIAKPRQHFGKPYSWKFVEAFLRLLQKSFLGEVYFYLVPWLLLALLKRHSFYL